MKTPQWVIDFLSDLALLLGSQSELDTALETLAITAPGAEQQELIKKLVLGVRSGCLLSAELARFPRYFDRVLCGMVAAGEAASDLPRALEQVTDQLIRARELRSKIINALIYPAILSLVLLVSLLLILLFILPQLATVVDSLGDSPSRSVQVLVGFGYFLQQWGGWLLGFLVLFSVATWVFRLEILRWFPITLPSPFHRLRTKLELSRLTGTLASLLDAGLSQIAALKIARDSLPVGPRRDSLIGVIERVEQGEPLSESMLAMGDVGALIAHGIRAGEQSGRLPYTLFRLSRRLEREFTVAAERLAAVAQPVLIIVMGLVIGLVVLTVFSALQSVGQFEL